MTADVDAFSTEAIAYDSNPLIRTGGAPLTVGHTARLAALVDAYGWDRLKRDCPDANVYLHRLDLALAWRFA